MWSALEHDKNGGKEAREKQEVDSKNVNYVHSLVHFFLICEKNILICEKNIYEVNLVGYNNM